MRRAGFTLIELLIVIGVITLLLAISLPALQYAKGRSKSVVCSSNIKQLVIGMTLYESVNKTFPYGFQGLTSPPPGGYPGRTQYDKPGWWWFNYISDYSKKEKRQKQILWCPSNQLSLEFKNNVLCGNYGVNQSICKNPEPRRNYEEFTGKPLQSSEIPYSSQTLLLVDCGYSIVNWYHATDLPPVTLGSLLMEDTAYIPGLVINQKRKLQEGQKKDAIDGRHLLKTVNAGFVDGHVSSTKADNLLAEKRGEIYKNLVPLWRPE